MSNKVDKQTNDVYFIKKHVGLWGSIRRFVITNRTAYAIVTFLHLKQIKNFFENLFSKKNKDMRIIHMIACITKQPFLSGFQVDIVSHCNLNCKYCGNFSPLVKEKFLSLEEFTKDLERVAFLTGGNIGAVRLMGGEPLLHPEFLDFVKTMHRILPKTDIMIVTNGILLQRRDDDFWQTLHDYDVIVCLTCYPIKLNLAEIDGKASKFGVRINYTGLGEGVKKMFHLPLDLSGKQPAVQNYIKCGGGNGVCVYLNRGKFFTCATSSTIEFFNGYFKTSLEITEKDYIDIHKAQSIDEILEFLAKPIPFCRYCNIDARTYNHKWEISKRDIKEWT
jgi:hypothetical protein